MPIIKISDDEQWEFDFDNPSIQEARRIEHLADCTYLEWLGKARKMSAEALVILIYVLKKRTEKAVNIDNIEFGLMDFEVIPTAEELAAEEAAKAEAEAEEKKAKKKGKGAVDPTQLSPAVASTSSGGDT